MADGNRESGKKERKLKVGFGRWLVSWFWFRDFFFNDSGEREGGGQQ